MGRADASSKPPARLILALFAVCVVAAAGVSPAAASPKPRAASAKLQWSPSPALQGGAGRVERTVLENGLIVLIEEDHTLPVVAFEARVKGGSRLEGLRSGSGIAHYIEHLLFKGTPTRPAGRIEDEVREYEGEMNAFTSADYTGFSLEVGARYASQAAGLMADILMHPTLPADELAKERDVIHSEMQMNEDDPDRRIYQLLWETALSVHPYRVPILGYRSQLDALTREDLLAYMREQYTPNNTVLAITGDVDAAAMLRLVREQFGPWERRPPVAEAAAPERPQLGPKRRTEEHPVELARMMMAFRSVELRHPDLCALDVLATILGQGESSRLNERLRHQDRLVYSIASWNYTPHDPGLLVIQATLEPNRLAEAEAAIWDEIRRLQEKPVQSWELEKAKRSVQAQYLLDRQTVAQRAGDAASNELLTDLPDFSRRYVDGISRVTATDVQQLAQRYLRRDHMTVVSLVPPGTQAATAPVVPVERPAVEKLILPNGVVVLLRPQSRWPLVSVRVAWLGGVRAETGETNGLSHLTAAALLKGTQTHSAQALAQLVESWGASLAPFSGKDAFGLSLDLLTAQLPEGLDLLHELMTRPTFPAQEVDQLKAETLAAIRAEDEDVFQSGNRLMRATLFAVHPYQLDPLGTTASVAHATPAQCAAFFQQQAVPSRMVISVFGSFEPLAVKRQLTKLFGALPERPSIALEPPAEPAWRKGRTAEVTLPKEQALLLWGFPAVSWHHPDRDALEVAATILGGSGGRLYQRIRERFGLSYVIGAQAVFGLDPGYLVLYVATRPDDLPRAAAELQRVVADLRTQPVTAEELQRAQRELIGAHRSSLQVEGSLALQSGLDELFGLGYDHYEHYEAAIQHVQIADVEQVLARYLLDQPPAVVTVHPSPAATVSFSDAAMAEHDAD